MLMIDNIKNYLYDKKYFVNLYDSYIHIFNFNKLLDFNHNIITLKMPDFILDIIGNNLTITKMTNNELLIKGCVNKLEFKYE